MVAFENITTPLQFLHHAAGVCTLAVSVHFLMRCVQHWRTPQGWRGQLRLHATLLLIFYGATYVLGALIYPTFRVRVRGGFLDATFPWATGLFEIKEHGATLMLLPVAGLFVMSRILDFSRSAHRPYAALVSVTVFLVVVVVGYNACLGWYLGVIGRDR